MDRRDLYESWIFFTETTSSKDSIFTICVQWPHSITHILVIVNVNGQLRYTCIFHRSKVNRLLWSPFSRLDSHKVIVCGLKLDIHGMSGTEYELYSVEGVDTCTCDLFEITFIPNLRGGAGHRLLGSLGHQTDLSVKETFTPPMSHSLKMELAQDTKGVMCIVYNEREKKEHLIVAPSPKTAVPLLPILQSRTIYRVQAVTFNFSKQYSFGEEDVVASLNGGSGKSGVLVVKSTNSKQDLQKLHIKAEEFCRTMRVERTNVDSFHRTKLKIYYLDILNNRGGIMEKYIKDNNGDPHSPINNKINGLFFFGKTVSIAPFSHFGNSRMFVPADELITQNTRMYFADFYCHYKDHYVTVVLTLRGSPEDIFCERSLLELDLKDNPFFTVQEYSWTPVPVFCLSSAWMNPQQRYAQTLPQPLPQPNVHPPMARVPSRSFRMVSGDRFHVEFFYTENIDIRQRQRKWVKCKGVSKPNGIPKNVDCTICNLEPVPPTAGFASMSLF